MWIFLPILWPETQEYARTLPKPVTGQWRSAVPKRGRSLLQSVCVPCQGQGEALSFHVVSKTLTSQGFGLFPEDAIWEWPTGELAWSDTELGPSARLTQFHPQLFSDLQPQTLFFFYFRRTCSQVQTTGDYPHRCLVPLWGLNPSAHAVAVI